MTDPLTRALLAGQAALERDDVAGTVTAFRIARDLVPSDVSIAIALANACRLAGDTLAAREALLHVQGMTSDASLTFALGSALLDAGAPAEASACFARVVQALPRDPAALAALAGALRTIGRPDQAWPFIHRAITVAPSLPAALVTASQIRHDLGDLRGALTWLDRADAERPDHGPTRLLRAYTMLMDGASAEAWAMFESRPLPVPATQARAWYGESMEGMSVLVTAEQGVGDQFQFLRFLPALGALDVSRVIVECHADAVTLLRANGIDAVVRGGGAGGAAPETDWHVPLLSLPHRLGVGANVMGDAVPYLRADAAEVARAAALLPVRRDGFRRIGLVWAGNPAFPGRVTRDLDVSLLPTLAAIPGVQWVALQHGTAGDVEVPGLEHVPLPGDWAATAAMLASLDGLVSTDTGIVHLAGAMGVRTWTLLQKTPDWRWGMHGDSTPWYPSMRLVRQEKRNDWAGAVQDISEALAIPDF